MIQREVFDRALNFKLSLDRLVPDQPKYHLDFTWPSVGIVDLLLRPYRGRTLTAADDDVILGAAAYLGGLAHDSWNTFFDKPDVELLFAVQPAPEILLRASGGSFAKARPYTVPIVSALKRLLRDTGPTFPFFERASRPRSGSSNIISPFTAGLVCGLSPWGEGPWRDLSAGSFRNLMAADDLLSRSSADRYARLFPSEPHGADPELYRHHLVLPPPFHEEQIPYERALAGFARYVNAREISGGRLIQLCQNLLQSPDDTIATAAFGLLGAIAETATPRLLAAAEAFGAHTASLRPVVFTARALLGRTEDWLMALNDGARDEALRLVLLDASIGLLPHLLFDPSFLDDPDLFPLLHHLSWGELPEARSYLELYLSKKAASTALVLQSVHLALAMRDRDLARTELSAIDPSTLSAARTRARYYVLDARANPERARSSLAQAIAVSEPVSNERSRALVMSGESFLAEGNATAARPLFEELANDTAGIGYLRGLLGLASIALAESDETALEGHLRQLIALAPQHPAVFHLAQVAGVRRTADEVERKAG